MERTVESKDINIGILKEKLRYCVSYVILYYADMLHARIVCYTQMCITPSSACILK